MAKNSNKEMTSLNNELVTPAFSEVTPKLKWNKLSSKELDLLNEWSSLAGEWQRIKTKHNFPYGYFRCKTPERYYFIKILQNKHANNSIKADEICQFLTGYNIVTNRLITPNYKKITFQNKLATLLYYSYLPGRFSDNSIDDCKLLGSSIAKLHKALEQYPHQEKVKHSHNTHEEFLKQHFYQLIHNKDELNKLPKKAQSIILENNEHLLEVLQLKPQVIHGDLNAGNILFTNDGLHIIDFEDSLKSWASPIQDIAFAIERFICLPFLKNNNDLSTFKLHLNAFLSHYFDNNDSVLSLISADTQIITKTLKALSLKSLLILAQQSEAQGETVHLEEWEKFIFLWEFNSKYQQLISDCVSNWLSLFKRNEYSDE